MECYRRAMRPNQRPELVCEYVNLGSNTTSRRSEPMRPFAQAGGSETLIATMTGTLMASVPRM